MTLPVTAKVVPDDSATEHMRVARLGGRRRHDLSVAFSSGGVVDNAGDSLTDASGNAVAVAGDVMVHW